MARRRRRRGRWIAAAVIVLALVGAGVAVATVGGGEPQAPTETVEVTRQDLTERASATGNAEPTSSRSLGFPTGGRIVEVAVRPGDQVAAGQLLGRVDDADARQAVAAAEAELASAEAALADAEAGATPADRAVAAATIEQARVAAENAESALEEAASDTAASTEQAEQEVARAAAELEAAKAERDQAAHVLEAAAAEAVWIADGQVEPPPDPAVAEAEAALAAAEQRVAAAQQALSASRQAEEAAEAQEDDAEDAARAEAEAAAAAQRLAEAQAAQSVQGTRVNQIVQADAAVRGARVALEGARRQLGQAVLTAPVDGTVASVNGRVGELTGAEAPATAGGGDTAASAAGATAFVILHERGPMEVRAGFAEVDAARLARDQVAEIAFDALPGETVPGRVLSVDLASVTESNVVTYYADLALDTIPRALRPGMTATVDVTLRTAEDVLVVPAAAVRQEGRDSVVSVPRGQEQQTVPVTLGLRGEGMVEVLEGLEEGDEVVLPPPSDAPPAPGGGL